MPPFPRCEIIYPTALKSCNRDCLQGWRELVDLHGVPYYYNIETKKSSFEHPCDKLYRYCSIQCKLIRFWSSALITSCIFYAREKLEFLRNLRTASKEKVDPNHRYAQFNVRKFGEL